MKYRYSERGFWGKLTYPSDRLNFWDKQDQLILRVVTGSVVCFALIAASLLV